MNIKTLLDYEKYIPVLTAAEVEALKENRPSLAQLQDWSQRLDNYRARLETAFSRAYAKNKL